MVVIPVELAGRSYSVTIEAGLLSDLALHAKAYLKGYRDRAIPFVTDANTHDLYKDQVEAALDAAGHSPHWFVVDPGEGAKSWEVLEELTNWLLAKGVTRSDHVFALGGGVVGDLTGFACAVTKRGCNFVQIPTTLLAQVDSSVGGKTAINTRAGKNLIGAFHQPSAVFIDPLVLDTLPEREMQAGYAEVLKYGLLGDAEFFDWLEVNGAKVIARESEQLTHAIATSIRAKARIVAEDERETSGVRALLNLGHTFAHALELEAGYSGDLLHGEAVSIGLDMAHRFSAEAGLCSKEDARRVTAHLKGLSMPTIEDASTLLADPQALLTHMRQDKKNEGDQMTLILTRGIGQAFIEKDVSASNILRFLEGLSS